MSNYKAVICALSNVRTFPGADRLLLADAAGYQVVVSRDSKDGDFGIVIPEGCALSSDFCLARGLFSKHPDTGEKLGGYLDKHGRVRAMMLRGEMSEGLFLPMSPDTGAIGDMIDSLPNFPNFVRKYETPAQIREAKGEAMGLTRKKKGTPGFQKHYDTGQVRNHIRDLAETNGFIVVTEKVHGTSGRTAKLFVEQAPRWIERAWNAIAPKRWAIAPKRVLMTVSGTRNCELSGLDQRTGRGYRHQIHNYFASCLAPGETVYYEIVGFTDSGKSIMPAHNLQALDGALPSRQAKELRTQFGNSMIYAYGCKSDGATLDQLIDLSGQIGPYYSIEAVCPRFRVFVYRITQLQDDGSARELSRIGILARLEMIGWGGMIDPVPILDRSPFASEETLLAALNDLTRGPSTIDRSHIREGICVRIEGGQSPSNALKHKGFVFCVLEGIAANDPDFIDPEAVS